MDQDLVIFFKAQFQRCFLLCTRPLAETQGPIILSHENPGRPSGLSEAFQTKGPARIRKRQKQGDPNRCVCIFLLTLVRGANNLIEVVFLGSILFGVKFRLKPRKHKYKHNSIRLTLLVTQ